jgi:hypothetical protein
MLGVFALVVGTALFCLVLAIFYRIGMLVGECLEAAGPPLQGYTLNLAGSLAGTLAFTALVFFSLPPWAWILPVFAGLVYFSSQRTRDALILGVVLAVIAATEISSPVQWSPYYRVGFVVQNVLIVFPTTAHLSRWYASAGLAGIVLIALAAVYGFYTALAGQPIFTGAALDK